MGALHRHAIRVVATLLSLSLVLGVIGPAAAAPPLWELTLTGPGSAILGDTLGFGGRLSAGPTPLPGQRVDITLDGSGVTSATTSSDGTYSVSVTFSTLGSHVLRAVAHSGSLIETPSAELSVVVDPPAEDPAPPVDDSVSTDIYEETQFLYEGSDPVQVGVAPGTIKPKRVAVLRGEVVTRSGDALQGVKVTVPDHPEFGYTETGYDADFDLAVNGGEPLVLRYEKDGFIPVERELQPGWRDFAVAPDVVMIPYDPNKTTVDLAHATEITVARGSSVSDSDGSRQATLMFTPGTEASMELPDGSTLPLDVIDVRATEFTVGPSGDEAMPAELPPTTAYTYAVELSVDQAVEAGATEVNFSEPVAFYVDNFLGFPTGTPVPVGYYDRSRHGWYPEPNGKVVEIVSITAGKADVDSDGDGVADSTLGLSDAERAELAELYAVGKTLWRVEVTHFSIPDLNFASGAPATASSPEQMETLQNLLHFCASRGSIIGCENQTLGESVSVAGTGFSLRYDTSRVPGRLAERSLDIPLTGATLPSSLKRVELDVEVAGRTFHHDFAPETNLRHVFTWDGKDAYGRALQGRHAATVTIAYVYDAVYYIPANRAASFGLPPDRPGEVPARREVKLTQRYQRDVGAVSGPGIGGLGGWSLSVHHSYDPDSSTLFLGSGGHKTAEQLFPQVGAVAGNGAAGAYNQGTYSGDGGQASAAGLSRVNGLAVAGDGTLYVADSTNGVVRKVTPAGVISTFAGGGTPVGIGDGGPATAAELGSPDDVALGADGSVYIADGSRVRRVDAAGIISTYAGGGNPVTGIGDGEPATQAKLSAVGGIALGPSGALYIADSGHDRIRKVTPDGSIETFAGGGTPADGLGDGLPASRASLDIPMDVAAGPDGTVYVSDIGNHRVRAIDATGVIRTFAGNGEAGFSGDGGPATQARMTDPTGVAVDPSDGSVYVAMPGYNRIRRVPPEGVITTHVGSGQRGFAGNDGPPVAAKLNNPNSIAFSPDGNLYIADTDNYRVRRVLPSMPGFASGDFLVPHREVIYQFDASGRHLRTLDALSSTVIWKFGYDSEGRLVTVSDDFDNVTQIERDPSGVPLAIVSPDGLRTALGLEGGWISQITNPEQESVSMTYHPGGLLETFTTPSGTSTFTYDSLGRLTLDEGPSQSSTALLASGLERGVRVTKTTAEGRVTTYDTVELASGATKRIVTLPSGAKVEAVVQSDGTMTMTFPDGTHQTSTAGPDPRWGMQSPVSTSTTVRFPSGRTLQIGANRSTTLTDPGNLLSLATQTDTITYAGDVFTRTYDAATRTITESSPDGRTATTKLDAKGLVTETQRGNDHPVALGYDLRGRMTSVSQGAGASARTTTFSYGLNGFLDGITAPLEETSFVSDDVGRVETLTRDEGNSVAFSYDDSSNLKSLTPPGRPAHIFDYRADDSRERYRPPALEVIAEPSTSYSYDRDHRLELIDPPGSGSIDLGYDSAGRLDSLTWSEGTIDYSYDPSTSQLTAVTSPGGNGLALSYDGALMTGVTTTGVAPGSVSYSYGSDLRPSGRTIAGASSVSYAYDDDGLLTSAGALSLTWDPVETALTSTTVGSITSSYGYDSFGELTTSSASHSGTSLLSAEFTRDKQGRIATRTETIAGETKAYSYTYDDLGRLTDIELGGNTIEHYEYDANGNRTAATINGAAATGSYDAQDRLTSYGDATYTYNAAGHLDTKSVPGAGTTDYDYDELGNLTQVALPGGTEIAYVTDGIGNRVARKVNGSVVQRFVYGAGSRPVAEYDGPGNLVATFVYATSSHSPDLMTKNGVTYRIVSDHLGSPRLVVNSSTGEVAQRIDYDSFGNVTNDTNPGFQPFGFAGGLYDSATGLVRFGARDYDAEIGRWTAKDPIDFAGGDANLFAYVSNDPINFIDPTGTTTLTGDAAGLGRADGGGLLGGLAGAGRALWDAVIVGGGAVVWQGLFGGPDPLDQICSALTQYAHLVNEALRTHYDAIGAPKDGWLFAKDSLSDKPGKIAAKTGLPVEEVLRRIHRAKKEVEGNPDVYVDTVTGEIYPKTPDGGHGDSIGNIYE